MQVRRLFDAPLSYYFQVHFSVKKQWVDSRFDFGNVPGTKNQELSDLLKAQILALPADLMEADRLVMLRRPNKEQMFMNTIPFIMGRLPDPTMAPDRIQKRLKLFYGQLSAKRLGKPFDEEANDVPWDARNVIKRRAESLHECDVRTSVFAHLRDEQRRRLEQYRDGLKVVPIPSEHRADEIAAALHEAYPWMELATTTIWDALRRSVVRGDPGVRLPPVLLDGGPGVGKSRYGRHLGTLIGLPSMVVEASTEIASFGLVGTQRGWGTAAPGRLVNHLMQSGIANSLVVVDEIEKAGAPRSTKGMSYSLSESLLPLFEPLTSGRWTCPYYEIPFDMSWVVWILTSNNASLLPEPLLSRCPPISVPAPSTAQLKQFARWCGRERSLSDASIDAVCEAIHQVASRQNVDLRRVARMLDRAETLEGRPPLH